MHPPLSWFRIEVGGKERKEPTIERHQFTEETNASRLAKFLDTIDCVLYDTCSLMEESFGPFLDCLYLSREYAEKNTGFIMVDQVVAELERHAKTGETSEKRIDAKRALRFVKIDKKSKKLFKLEKVNHSASDFADSAIFSLIAALRVGSKVLLITQDKKLCDDVRKLNSLDSQHGRHVLVYKVNRDGLLEENRGSLGLAPVRRTVPPRVPATVKTVAEKPKKVEAPKLEKKPVIPSASLVPSDIATLDRSISSNVNNSTYPLAKKLADIERQLKNLSGYDASQISSWKLLYEVKDLEEAKAKLGTDKPAETKVETKPEPAKPEKKPEPVKEAPKKKAVYGKGDTLLSAIKDLVARSGGMVRDDGVEYVKLIHGPYDLVVGDFLKIARETTLLPANSTRDVTLKGLTFHIEKGAGVYRVTFEENKVKPVEEKPKVEKSPQKSPQKSEIAKKEAPKKATKAPAKKPEEAPKKEVEATKKPRTPHSPDYEAAIKCDKDLKAKAYNPTYPLESKIKEIEEQEARVRKLKQSELKDLNYTVRGLQKLLKEVKGENK